MENYTPEELEQLLSYKKWFESQNPTTRSLEEQLENQRASQATAELVARGERAAKKPITTLGDLSPRIKETKIPSAAESSARTFEEAGKLTSEELADKKNVERIVQGISKKGKTAEESAKVFEDVGLLPSKELADKKNVERIVQDISKGGRGAEESAKVFRDAGLLPSKSAAESAEVFLSAPDVSDTNKTAPPQLRNVPYSNTTDYNKLNFQPDDLVETKNLSTGNKRIDSLISKVGGGIESGGKKLAGAADVVTSKLPSAMDKLAKLGLAKEVYDIARGEGDLVETGLSLGSAAASKLSRGGPLVSAILEAITPVEVGGGTYDELEKRLSDPDPNKRLAARQQLNEIGRRTYSSSTRVPTSDGNQSEVSGGGAGGAFIPFKSLEDKLAFENSQSIKNSNRSAVSAASGGTSEPTNVSESPLLSKIIEETAKKPQETDILALLEQAKQNRDKQQLLANLGMAGETISSALGGVVSGGTITKPTGTDFYDKLIKQAEQPVEDVGTAYTIKTKQDEMERLARRRDPGSEESKFARDLLAQQGIKVPEAATAEALEKYAPQLTNILNQREAREARAASARERALDRATILEGKLEGKKLDAALRLAPKIQNKQFETLSEVRSQSALMKESLKNPNPTRDVAIIYGFVKALDPKSAVREGEIDFVQLGRSVPTKINQYFKRAFTGEILPEKARKEMADYIAQREKQAYKEWDLSAGPYLRQADKAGIDRELVAPGSTEMESPIEEQKKTDPKVKEYAEKNSISYDQAENILRARGYGK